MKAKIFAKLKQEYSSLGLGDAILMSRAEALAAMGLVTDENIDAVVAVQRNDLEGLQKANDKRVTDALEKERKKQEEETCRKQEEKEAQKAAADRKAAEEKAAAEKELADKAAADKAEKDKADEAARLKAEIDSLREKGVSEAVLDYIKSLQDTVATNRETTANQAKKEKEAFDKAIGDIIAKQSENQKQYLASLEALTKQNEELRNSFNALNGEYTAAKEAKSKADRQAFIVGKAKELGVPQWRIDEGFAFGDDAGEEAIVSALTVTANNIKTSLLPEKSGTGAPVISDKPSDEQIGAFAQSLISKAN